MDKDKLLEAEEERFRRLMEVIAEQERRRLLELNERLRTGVPPSAARLEFASSCV